MIAVQSRYVRRRVKSIAFHISARGMSVIHTALSGAACLLFFGGMSCLMGLFQ
jgi:hypothetical protein